jgi:ubiquinone/menaquinone biosynthesis C-methylase UbiE
MNAGEPFVHYLLSHHVAPGAVMLDIGCGPSHYRRSPRGRYVGIDVTDTPYADGLPRDVDAIAIGQALPFGARSFDLVMVKSTLYYLADPGAALREILRVLKDGGRVLVIDYNRRELARLRRIDPTTLASWTQRELRGLVRRCGFRDCEILSAVPRELGRVERLVRPFLQERLGSWAIVTGVK